MSYIYCPVCEDSFEIDFEKLKEIDEEYDTKIHELHDKRRVIISDVEDFKEIEERADNWNRFIEFKEALKIIKEYKEEYADLVDIKIGD